MIGKIQRLHSRKKKVGARDREIARITGMAHNTVAKSLHGELDGQPKFRRGGQLIKASVSRDAANQPPDP